MSGTIQTPSELMSVELPDNTSEDILPINLRNVAETFAGSPSQTFTASRVVVVADRGTTLNMNSASALNVTVNSGVLTAGQQFGVRQIGAGQATIVPGSGMTVQSSSGTFATRAQWSLIIVTLHTDGTTILLDGDLA